MLWLALSVLNSLPPPVPVEKGTLFLQAAVDGSTLVCIGTVTGVDKVTLPADWNASRTAGLDVIDRVVPTESPFGRIVVERVLKGDPTTKLVYHEAWTTWVCDTTSAHEGERCLFFLRPCQVETASQEVRNAISTAFGGAPVLRNIGAGSGIVPILFRDGQECVKFSGAPDDLHIPDVRYHQRLASVIPYIETLARFAPERVVLHATSRADSELSRKRFDFRVLADGGARLATNRGEVLRMSALDESSWRVLQASLATQVGSEPISFGEPGRYNPYRSLRVALPGAQLSFTDDDSVIVSGMEDADLARYRRVLRTWALVRETMDCADCVDHRPADRDVLAR